MATIDLDLPRRWSDEPVTPRRQAVLADTESPGPRRWTPFVVAAAVGAITLLAFLVLVVFGAAGATFGTAIDPIFQAAVALAAAVSCLLLARSSKGKLRLAWSLIGLSPLITFCVGVGSFVFYQVTTGRPVPFPSPADALYLVGEAALIAGLLSFPSSPTGASSRSRVTIDGLVIGLSLLYMAWAFGLVALYTNAHISFLAGAVILA